MKPNMIHSSGPNPPFYHSEKERNTMLTSMEAFPDTFQVEKKVVIEKNHFGYIINTILATTWLFLFSNILAVELIDLKWNIAKKCFITNLIPRYILAMAALLTGSFHAYILYDNNETKNKDSDLVSKLTSAWPLVLGTLIYFIIACFVYKDFATNNYRIQNLIIFLISLSIPVSFCGFFLFGDFSSSIFSPWTVKIESQTTIEAEESASECRIVGFICFISLAAFWSFCIFLIGDNIIFHVPNNLQFATVTFICGFVHFGALLYTLSTPKYDSGDSSNWIEFSKKNWLIILNCSILTFYLVVFVILSKNKTEIKDASMIILLSICTLLLMIPSNSSQYCVRHFKPWNSVKKFDHI